MKEKIPLLHEFVCFEIPKKRSFSELAFLMRNYLFLKNYVTSEEAVSHNVFDYITDIQILVI